MESLDPGFKKCIRFRSLNSRGERALERTSSYEAVYVTEGALVHKNICDSFFYSVFVLVALLHDFQSCLRVWTWNLKDALGSEA